MSQDDPRGLKPVLRLTAAIITSFAGCAFFGMLIVGSIVEEPDGWRILKFASGIAFAICSAWSAFLYKEWKKEERNR